MHRVLGTLELVSFHALFTFMYILKTTNRGAKWEWKLEVSGARVLRCITYELLLSLCQSHLGSSSALFFFPYNISKTIAHTAKQSKIWAHELVSHHVWGTFNLVIHDHLGPLGAIVTFFLKMVDSTANLSDILHCNLSRNRKMHILAERSRSMDLLFTELCNFR